jgi:hypothetical protein
MTLFRWLWTSGHYWPIWMLTGLSLFLLREIWALASGHAKDTLSDWTWNQLHITENESFWHWSQVDLLVFCTYVTVFVIWLPWHFFFHRFD